jgi:hypothetical protein
MTESSEVENEDVVRARIAADVDEAIKLMGVPGVFSDEELEENLRAAIAASQSFSDDDDEANGA